MRFSKSFIFILIPVLLLGSCKAKTTSALKESAEENCKSEARVMNFLQFAIAPLSFVPKVGGIITSPLKMFISQNTPNCADLTFARWMAETKVVLSLMNSQFMDFADSYYSNFETVEGSNIQNAMDILENNIEILDKLKGYSKVATSTRDALTTLKNKIDAETAIVSKGNAKIPEIITAYKLGFEMGAVAVGQGKVFEDRYSRIKFRDLNEKVTINQVRSVSTALRASYRALISALIAKRNDQAYFAKIVPVLSPTPFFKTKEVNDRDCTVVPDAFVLFWEGQELDVKFGGDIVYHLESLGSIASRVDLRANLEGQVLRVKLGSKQSGICTWDELNKVVNKYASDQLQNYYNNGIPDAVNAKNAFDNSAKAIDIDVLNKALDQVK